MTRINAFSGLATQKVVAPSILLTLDWLALRSVLNKAATQGDVAAIPDALAWAELAYAKIPDKSAEVIAAEAKEREQMEASAQEMATAAAAEADREVKSAADVDLEFHAVPPPAKASSGCSPDADAKVDPTAVEFKN